MKMKINTKSATLVLISLTLSGCGECPFVAMPEELLDQISSSNTYVVEPPQKLAISIDNSNISTLQTSSGGLIGSIFNLTTSIVEAGVNSARKADANKALEEAHKGYEHPLIRQKLLDAIKVSINNTKWLHSQKIEEFIKPSEETELSDNTKENLLKASNEDATMICTVEFQFNPQIDVLTGTLFVTLYPTSERLLKIVNSEKPLKKPILKFRVTATYKLAQSNEDININGKAWSENNCAVLNQALSEIITKIASELETSLKDPSAVIQ
jgi:hypothetical protein